VAVASAAAVLCELVSVGGIGMARRKISYPDHAWLRMDDPNNLMVITGLMTFDAPLDYERLKATIEHSLLKFSRFRQRLAPPIAPFMRPYWEDDPTFNLESHIERVHLPSPGDHKVLQELISALLSTGLDTSRPLWQFYLVENYGEGSAFIARLHHSIADGIALMQLLLTMTDSNPNPSPPGKSQDKTQNGEQSPGVPIKTHKSAFLNSDNWSAKKLREEGEKILFNPSHARYRTRQVIDLAASVGRLVLRWPDPLTVFKGSLGREKRAAWSEPVALKDVKYIGKTFNSTVNDVLLTAVAGALGRYIDYRGEAAKNVSIRSFIPVNLRPIQLDEELGNKFGLTFLSLPMGIADPYERLLRVKQNMDEIKSSSEAVATFGIINLLGAVPSWIEEIGVNFFDTKGSSIMTNVPGPQTQLYLAGAPIHTLMAWVPQSGRIALGVSIVSYNGKVWMGIATDKSLLPDPEAIIEFFHVEYNDMLTLAQKVQAERQQYLQPMLSMLDNAIKTVDELLAEASKQ
jgi:diacylglycerol O-acyltransferase